MQVALNPLVTNVVAGNRLASTLTFGQFVKEIASFLGPVLAAWAAIQFGDWKMLFPIFMVVAIVATLLLWITNIPEQQASRTSSFKECFSLLSDSFILICFVGIMCHVGIVVGANVTAPKLLMELDYALVDAGVATMVYFIMRTFGCLSGSYSIPKLSY